MISVIVPVYNVEDYLPHCLESIASQTYTDFEAVLVDDGSTDSSGRICDGFCARDPRFRVIHQENQGPSGARNTGLRETAGDFVCFIDGDDYLHPQMLETQMLLLRDSDYDLSMIYGRPVREDEAACTVPLKGSSPVGITLSASDLLERLYGPSGTDVQYHVVWNKLYRRELIQGLEFAGTYSEDLHFNSRAYQRVRKAAILTEPMYYWVQREGSITHSGVSMDYIGRIGVYLLCLRDIPEEQKAYRGLCLGKLYKTMLHTRYHARNSGFGREAGQACRAAYAQTAGEYLRSDIPLMLKYGLLFLYHFPPAYSAFMAALRIRTGWMHWAGIGADRRQGQKKKKKK